VGEVLSLECIRMEFDVVARKSIPHGEFSPRTPVRSG
jgi:hypothetical protein